MVDIADSELPASRYAFRADHRPLWRGLLGAVAAIAGYFTWAWWEGRLGNADPTYWAIVLASMFGSLCLIGRIVFANARKAAMAAGAIEIDTEGIRWRGGDDVLVFDVPWHAIAVATIDRRVQQILIRSRDNKGFLIRGQAASLVVERFSELERAIAHRVALKEHKGSEDRVAARRVLVDGMLAQLVAVALYGANRGFAATMHWTHLLSVMPIVVSAMGMLTIGAGIRIWLGRGPLVSELYHRGSARPLLRFLIVASIANFIIVAGRNGLTP